MMTLLLILLTLICCCWVSTVTAVTCPTSCKCSWILDSLEANCANRGLTSYPSFDDIPVESLDLSGNKFHEFPIQYADIDSLIRLDLSNNQIQSLNATALIGFTSLRTLLLTNNSITSWNSINANIAFQYANSLTHLSLSGNELKSFIGNNDADDEQQLNSQSLTELELSNCGIETVGGDHLINHLPNLERLRLSNNNLIKITGLPSKSLRALDMSNCSLQRFSSSFIDSMPNLEILNLSRNPSLKFGTTDDIIMSYGLRLIDLTNCNLDEIDLSGLPSLTVVSLRGNMLRSLDATMFQNNTLLEKIDLSLNAIGLINSEAFGGLKHLKELNLAYNEIARLDRNVIRNNDILMELNLSRNVIKKFTKIVSNSLRVFNLSWCEITSMDSNALSGLSVIQKLDLSNNLIADIPSFMRSETLQNFDISNCRLSTIRNSTFREFPELAALHLNGNRLTTPIPSTYFRSNKFLDQIWLGDNPWICNCYDPTFVEFYNYLTAVPAKIKDRNHLRCGSPSIYYGRLWESACMGIWVQNERNSSTAESFWSSIMIGILVIGGLIFAYVCMQRLLAKRKENNNRREYEENHDEMRRIQGINDRLLQEETGSVRAPMSHETNLPSYEDALRMPKLERPVKSMLDLTATERIRKYLRRSQTQDDADGNSEDENELQLDTHQRFRSVEMLSNRDKERTAQYGPFRRTGRIEYNQSGSRIFSIEDSRFPAAHLKTQNLQSAEQIGNFQSYENSPYTKRKPKIAEIPPFKRANMIRDSIEFLTDPEYENISSKPGSPFAKRKPKLPPKAMQVNAQVYTMEEKLSPLLDPAVEDYFGAAPKPAISSSTIASDFQELQEPELTSLPDNGSNSSSKSHIESDMEKSKRKKRKNSINRKVSENFSAAAAADVNSSSSGDDDDGGEHKAQSHKTMRETLF